MSQLAEELRAIEAILRIRKMSRAQRKPAPERKPDSGGVSGYLPRSVARFCLLVFSV